MNWKKIRFFCNDRDKTRFERSPPPPPHLQEQSNAAAGFLSGRSGKLKDPTDKRLRILSNDCRGLPC